MSSSTYNGPRDNMLYHKTCNIMYTALTDMICTLLQCNVCTCEPASVVEQLVKGQRSYPTLKPHMHNSLNHSLQLKVCMALTLFLCRKSASKVSHSSCTRPLWPLWAATRTAVQPFWWRGGKKLYQMCTVAEMREKEHPPKSTKVPTEPHWVCAVIFMTS